MPTPPTSWSGLTWQQLCACWRVKIRYGANADAARAAALLELCGCVVGKGDAGRDAKTGEELYRLRDADGKSWLCTPRELAYLAKHALPWFDFPYGDRDEKEVRDEKGKIVKERRKAIQGYVGPMQDALVLPVAHVRVGRRMFALPQVACCNYTWQQYRNLQGISPQLFQEDVTDAQILTLHAQFLAHSMVPRSLAMLDTTGGSISLRIHHEYRYNADCAESMVAWWRRRLKKHHTQAAVLFHIVFQAYQTALAYYEKVYPLLFSDGDKSSPVRDALTGEVGTINTIMKYAGYAEQQQVYDSDLPFVLDILNTMSKEAKEIEKMNAKIKKK